MPKSSSGRKVVINSSVSGPASWLGFSVLQQMMMKANCGFLQTLQRVSLVALAPILLCIYAQEARANVFLAKDEALAVAFAAGVEVVEKSVVFSAEQKSEIETRSQAKVASSLFHYYEGRLHGDVTGYAVIQAQIMRTNLAVFMVVLSKDLIVQKVVMLAFNEPLEYMPADGWFRHLEGSKPLAELVPGQGLPAIAGSTLSVTGISDGVRTVKASLDVVIGEKR